MTANGDQMLNSRSSSTIAVVPVLVSAVVILIIGWIVGRVLGALVTRIVGRIGLSEYTEGTPLESDRGGDGGLADALGTLVAYIIYFYTALAAANVLGISILSQLLSEIGQFLPVVLSAIVVLVIGFVVGRVVGGIIEDLIGGFGLESYVRDTPLAGVTRAFGGFDATGAVKHHATLTGQCQRVARHVNPDLALRLTVGA